MQLFALDGLDNLIGARQAHKQKNYYCIECKGTVRLRGGLHRQKHFFHTHPTSFCNLHGKTMRHLQVQMHLQRVLPLGDLILEHPFPTIRRIADAVWLSRKIIFEVQCSGISPEEIMARNSDYESLGFRVVWILHEGLYNRNRVTAAETFLESRTHYFTNIDKEGKGFIYDQWDIRKNHLRFFRSEKMQVDITEPLGIDCFLHERAKTWSLHFRGDFLDCIKTDAGLLRKSQENAPLTHSKFPKVLEWFHALYALSKDLLLEKASK